MHDHNLAPSHGHHGPVSVAGNDASLVMGATQPLTSQQLGSQSLGSQSLASQTLGSQPLGPQQLGSQPLGSQPLGIDFEADVNYDEFSNLQSGFPDPMATNMSTALYAPFDQLAPFDDSFPYSQQFEPTREVDAFHEEEPSPKSLDSKLLSFSNQMTVLVPIDETGEFSSFSMSAELNGMFFVAEDVFGVETSGRPLELTCYRRNLWQCSAQVTLPRQRPLEFVGENNTRVTIVEYSASITATESIDHKATEIISVPWKNHASAAAAAGSASLAVIPPEEPRQGATAPRNIPINISSAKEIDATRVIVPLLWKRLQFKHATANNGRRKGQQQHYIVHVTLLGKTTTGEIMSIASVKSSPVIVRGRSPRNFDSKKDVQLLGEKKAERKNTLTSNPGSEREASVPVSMPPRFSSVPNIQATGDWKTSPAPYTTPASNSSRTPQVSQQQLPPSQPQHQHMSKKMAMSPAQQRPPIPAWSLAGSASVSAAGPAVGAPQQMPFGAGPMPLSLSEDERSPNRSGSDVQSPQYNKMAMMYAANQAAMEDADMLYEYFPLSVDDWMPPVDAVYRPHVVHHTIVPPELKAQQVNNKSKRYFVAD
ncbi:hypothetical protein TD95_003956 [Thielaviopsis punctulata]|uniref:NDT80 domain-containing protein n=1 Tax=Thielaviopsis punctulata TaxID=72032 RepID=A0A0F4ZA47_9PEZI|nr:hypothetical protein TD95_003956 [Thielaviopsis punctulata]